MGKCSVWEICKFWILQTSLALNKLEDKFERYVNFEFYKLKSVSVVLSSTFERYVNFEFYKLKARFLCRELVWEICKFWILQTSKASGEATYSLRDM